MSNRLIRGLYAIADTGLMPAARLSEAVEQAILGGARLIQYRDKSAATARRRQQAAALNALCRARQVPLIVNDDVDLAADVGAAGVHLGQDDPAPALARARLGRQAVIGVSCYNCPDLALAAARAGADYVAFGSFFASVTKPAAVRADIGLIQEVKRRLALPVVAIGGITPVNGRALVEAGADALAVISGVFAQADIRAAARAYADLYPDR